MRKQRRKRNEKKRKNKTILTKKKKLSCVQQACAGAAVRGTYSLSIFFLKVDAYKKLKLVGK